MSVHKCLHNGGVTRIRDSTPIAGTFGKPFARMCAVVNEDFHNGLDIACLL